MPLILGPAVRLGVRGRARGDDPRHQRRGDHLRADAGPDPRPGRWRVPVHQLRRPADRGAAGRAARRRCSGSARRSRSARSPPLAGVLFLVGSPILQLRELPEVVRVGRGAAPAPVTPSGRSAPRERPRRRPRPGGRSDRPGRPRAVAGPERGPEDVGQRRRRQDAGQRRERVGQVRDREDDPAEQQERDEQARWPAPRVASARRAPAISRPSPANASVPEQEPDDEQRPARRPVPGRQPRTRDGDRDEQDDLADLDDEDRGHLRGEQTGPGQRRAAEPLEDAVVALVGGRDAEVDQARRDDREREASRAAGSRPDGRSRSAGR